MSISQDSTMSHSTAERRAPVQGFSAGIPWDMHLRAYDAYSAEFSPQQALIEGGCRGGFSVRELDRFIPGWRDELDERKRLATRLEHLERALTEIREKASGAGYCAEQAVSEMDDIASRALTQSGNE